MLFNSYQYLIFFPIVVVIYYLLPHRHRWKMLLAASYYFYMCWSVKYLLLILITTAISYYTGLKMAELPDKTSRKKWLLGSLFVNLGLLFFFKYFNFFNENMEGLLNMFDVMYAAPELKILLPVGISFYTFQSLSYSLDIYYGRAPVEKHAGIFALFVVYFPQLVAGPIERSTNLIPELRREHQLNADQVVNGLNKMLYGYFKKVVIADRLGVYVTEVYNQPGDVDGVSALIAAYFFAIQIYCDFSGYSDIAIGSARVMGIKLMENFKKPFLSKSINDFWLRWHISLTTWFMDYVFVALGGYARKFGKLAVNLLIVSLLLGLWHGARWTYVAAYGILGVTFILYILYAQKFKGKSQGIYSRFPAIPDWLNVILIFHLFVFGCIFMRAFSIDDAMIMFSKIFSFDYHFEPFNIFRTMGIFNFAVCILSILMLFISYLLPFNLKFKGKKNLVYMTVMTMIIILMGYESATQFYYFQF